jgi:hypothetical protein
MKQHLVPKNELLPEEPERDDLSLSDEPRDAAVMELPGKALAHESASGSTVLPDTAMMDLSEMEMEQHGVADDVSPDVFPDSSLPEDTPDV